MGGGRLPPEEGSHGSTELSRKTHISDKEKIGPGNGQTFPWKNINYPGHHGRLQAVFGPPDQKLSDCSHGHKLDVLGGAAAEVP